MAGNIYHEWQDTVLVITSDSGTSSCDLKGAKGDDGCRGAQGAAGTVDYTLVYTRSEPPTAAEVGAVSTDTFNSAIGQINTDIDNLEAAVSEIDLSALETIQTDFDTVKATVAQHTTDINDINNAVLQQENQISVLATATNEHEVEINAMGLELDGISAVVDEHSTDLASLEGNVSTLQTDVEELKQAEISVDDIYPVGSIYLTVNEASPASIFGGTWEQLTDMFLLGAGNLYEVGSVGGSATHNHTLKAGHAKIVQSSSGYIANVYKNIDETWTSTRKASISVTTTPVENLVTGTRLGGNTDNTNILPPYLAVYMWKRIE